MATSQSYPIAVPAASPVEATRKTIALAVLAKLSADSLATLATAASKPDADATVKKYSAFL